MTKAQKSTCHSCGQSLGEEETRCPRCRVSRRGDVNRPMIAGYALFLLVAFVAGAITIVYLRNTLHIQQ